MNIVPVLKLDDDNHSPCYVTENGYWCDADSFMKNELCKPHSVEYKIKTIEYIYINPDLEYEGVKATTMFDRVDDYRINDGIMEGARGLTYEQYVNRKIAFDFFWNISEEDLYKYE